MNVLEVNFEKKLKNFPLHIQFQAEGGCIGILGASGCGKSMTFKAIAGIETPDSGKICLGKRELFHRGHKVNLPPRKRSVGYLFQSYALFPNMTVFQNIEAGIQGKKAAKRERAMEMMEKFHLSELASGYPARLSGGQQQRTLLARALCATSKVILLDEPVTGLDPKVTAEFYQVTKDLNEEGIAVIMVSHDVQALTYATHILHMDQTDSFYGTKEEYMNSDKWKLFKNTEEDRIGGEKK